MVSDLTSEAIKHSFHAAFTLGALPMVHVWIICKGVPQSVKSPSIIFMSLSAILFNTPARDKMGCSILVQFLWVGGIEGDLPSGEFSVFFWTFSGVLMRRVA